MRELQSKDYAEYIPLVKAADINTLFVQAVLEQKGKGEVYVEDKEESAFLYVINSFGMSLLYIHENMEPDYEQLIPYLLNEDQHRSSYEWLQVYPVSLAEVIEEKLGKRLQKMAPDEPYMPSVLGATEQVIGFQRMNYQFQIDKYLNLKKNTLIQSRIIRTSEEVFYNSKGSVVPRYFWKNYEDFAKNGIGFTILSEEGEPLSTAFAAFIIGNQLEIGIETSEESRGCGYATAVCMALIDYCLEKNLEPVWACNSGNPGSRQLSKKLGFTISKRLPYYRLPINESNR